MNLRNLFLDYANLPLLNNPENIRLLFSNVMPHFEGLQNKYLDTVIGDIIFFSSINDYREIVAVDKQLKSDKKALAFGHCHRIAFEAVHGYLYGFCERYCNTYVCSDFRNMAARYKRLGIRLKCHECEQLVYISRLADLAAGKSYRDMEEYVIIDQNLYEQYEIWHRQRSITPEYKVGDKDKVSSWGNFSWMIENAYDIIEPKIILNEDDHFDKILLLRFEDFHERPDSNYKYRFNDFLRKIISYSLVEFLINENRKKLKRCEKCKIFYISKTKRESKYCSDKCRLSIHNKRRIESGEHARYKKEKGYYKY